MLSLLKNVFDFVVDTAVNNPVTSVISSAIVVVAAVPQTRNFVIDGVTGLVSSPPAPEPALAPAPDKDLINKAAEKLLKSEELKDPAMRDQALAELKELGAEIILIDPVEEKKVGPVKVDKSPAKSTMAKVPTARKPAAKKTAPKPA